MRGFLALVLGAFLLNDIFTGIDYGFAGEGG